jgi:hypothetical protein
MMPELGDLSLGPLPDFGLIEAIAVAQTRDVRARLLAQLRTQNSRSRAALKEQRRRIENFLRQLAQRHLNAKEIASIKTIALEKRKAEQEEMQPALERLHRKIELHADIRGASVQRAFRESVDVTAAWLAAHEELTNRLLEFAARNRDADRTVLRARPVEGEIDHTALSREFMERFPNIRAALAE